MPKMTAKVAAVAVALACVLSSSASADPLSLSTAGVACTLDGKLRNSNPLTELGIAQQILDLAGLGAVGPVACVKCYRNSTVFDFEGSLSNPMQQRSGLIVPFGYEYALAKYAAGQNGGDVLFHVPTFSDGESGDRHRNSFGHARHGRGRRVHRGSRLPQYPANFWTTHPTQSAISHLTTFDTASVPDGGSAAALLGSALLAVGLLRRKFSRDYPRRG